MRSALWPAAGDGSRVGEGAPPRRAPAAEHRLLRRCACGGVAGPGGECADCRKKRLQKSAASHRGADAGRVAPPIVEEVLAGSGRPLETGIRGEMEGRFGHDFASVRVHADARGSESAAAVGARAYTVGHHLVFGAGQFSPGTADGQRLLAHELAHVVQQSGSAAAGSGAGSGIAIGPTDDAHEREAQRLAESPALAAVRGRSGQRLARAMEDVSEPVETSGCRKVTTAPCPGVKGTFTRLGYERAMHVVNRGSCAVFIGGIDTDGTPVDSSANVRLEPGASTTFVPPPGSVDTAFGCEIGCEGTARLSHPYNCA